MNSGFYLVKPSVGGIMLHARSLGLARIQPELSNQKTLTRTLNSMVFHNTIRPRYLSVEVYEIFFILILSYFLTLNNYFINMSIDLNLLIYEY